tara:strand:- start:12943 stop:13443 length:501 start_codon:yes stop_codon:yes gene_type:complete
MKYIKDRYINENNLDAKKKSIENDIKIIETIWNVITNKISKDIEEYNTSLDTFEIEDFSVNEFKGLLVSKDYNRGLLGGQINKIFGDEKRMKYSINDVLEYGDDLSTSMIQVHVYFNTNQLKRVKEFLIEKGWETRFTSDRDVLTIYYSVEDTFDGLTKAFKNINK